MGESSPATELIGTIMDRVVHIPMGNKITMVKVHETLEEKSA